MNRHQRRGKKQKPHKKPVITAEEKERVKLAINRSIELGLGSCLIALHDCYGFGRKRSDKVFQRAMEILEEYIKNSQDDTGYALRTLNREIRRIYKVDLDVDFAKTPEARKSVSY